MEGRVLMEEQLEAFASYLLAEEREPSTIRKYLRDLREFRRWLGEREVDKETAAAWKEDLKRSGHRPETLNSKLSAVNRFFSFAGWAECRLKYFKVQKKLFRSPEKELSREEYLRLVETAGAQGKTRLALLIETICATGIRVSEVRYITVEAVRAGRAEVWLKGKIRTILLPGKLCHKLWKYVRKQKITSGEIFLTRSGKGISRRQIWAEMKALCEKAGVAATKVFPHNLRHLFARTFYRVSQDIVKLADVMGHSSIETTRIYLVSSGREHSMLLEGLRLLC